MTDISAALMLTALAFLVTAAVVGTHASEAHWRQKYREVPIAWGAFALSIGLFIAGIWTQFFIG